MESLGFKAAQITRYIKSLGAGRQRGKSKKNAGLRPTGVKNRAGFLCRKNPGIDRVWAKRRERQGRGQSSVGPKLKGKLESRKGKRMWAYQLGDGFHQKRGGRESGWAFG